MRVFVMRLRGPLCCPWCLTFDGFASFELRAAPTQHTSYLEVRAGADEGDLV